MLVTEVFISFLFFFWGEGGEQYVDRLRRAGDKARLVAALPLTVPARGLFRRRTFSRSLRDYRLSLLGAMVTIDKNRIFEAERWLKRADSIWDLLSDFSLELRGDLHRKAGKFRKAADYYQSAAQLAYWKRRVEIRKKRLKVLLKAKDWPAVEAFFARFRYYARYFGGYRKFRWAQVSVKYFQKKWSEVAGLLKSFSIRYAGTEEARRAEKLLADLVRKGFAPKGSAELSPRDRWKKLQSLALYDPPNALRKLQKFWKNLPKSEQTRPENLTTYLYLKGEIARRTGNFRRAEELYTELLKKPLSETTRFNVLKRLWRVYRYTGDFRKAAELFEGQLKKLTPGENRCQVVHWAGWLALYGEEFSKAGELFQSQLDECPSSPKLFWRLKWLVAWTQFRDGALDEALKSLEQFDVSSARYISPLLLDYWKSRIEELSGNWRKALMGYLQLYRSYPLSYYGILARERLLFWRELLLSSPKNSEYLKRALGSYLFRVLNGNSVVKLFFSELIGPSEGRGRGYSKESLLGARGGAGASGGAEDESRFRASFLDCCRVDSAFPVLRRCMNWSSVKEKKGCRYVLRAAIFDFLGLKERAVEEFYRARYLVRRELKLLTPLLRWLHQHRFHHLSVKLARLGYRELSKAIKFKVERLKLLYPPAYREEVLKWAGKFGVSPFLIWAIMREESLYHPAATSYVNARGLMQIMPYTARKIAKILKHSYGNDDHLYRPELSIKFGAWYLSELSKKFEGNIILTAAAYNAGPLQVSAWLSRRKYLPPDIFVEEIILSQTRGYVKRIFRSFAIYSALYRRLPPPKLPPMAVKILSNVDF